MSFIKLEGNKNFNHEKKVIDLFADLGFYDLKISTCLKNGISHYVDILDFVVVNANKLYSEMFVYEGRTSIQVRVSDHTSNLDTICGGVSGNKMNLRAFKKLIESGAIKSKNN